MQNLKVQNYLQKQSFPHNLTHLDRILQVTPDQLQLFCNISEFASYGFPIAATHLQSAFQHCTEQGLNCIWPQQNAFQNGTGSASS